MKINGCALNIAATDIDTKTTGGCWNTHAHKSTVLIFISGVRLGGKGR